MKKFIFFLLLLSSFCQAQVNISATNHAYTRFPDTVNIGNIYLRDFTSSCALTDFTFNTTGSTAVCTGGFLRVTDADLGGFDNNLTYTSYNGGQGSTLENDSAYIEFYLRATGIGINMGFRSLANYSPVDWDVLWLMSGGADNFKMWIYQSRSLAVKSTANTISVGDKCRLVIKRPSPDAVLFITHNLTANTRVTHTMATTMAGSGQLANRQVYRPVFGWSGGTFDVSKIGWASTNNKNNRVIFVGNSLVQGYKATSGYTNRWASLIMSGSSKSYELLSGQGHEVGDYLLYYKEIIALRPQYVILSSLGLNDESHAINIDSTKARYVRLVNKLLAANINIIHGYGSPLNSVDVSFANTSSFNYWLQNYAPFSSHSKVDIYTPLKAAAGTGLHGTYDSGDGIHENNAGHTLIKNTYNAAFPWLFN